MVPPELVSYIVQQSQQGVSADALRQSLMEAGWRELDIDNALHDVAAGLSPVGDGASLHEDLAQVRGMVAHLAGRVRTIEVKLAVADLPTGQAGVVPLELPSGTAPMDRQLVLGHHSRFRTVLSFLIAGALIASLARFAAALVAGLPTGQAGIALAPRDLAVIAAALGLLLLIGGYVAMRMHRAWFASSLAGSGVAVWALIVWVARHNYQSLEMTTAIALGVMLAVLALVMGRWIDRYGR